MIDLTESIHAQKGTCQAYISLSGWLEVMVGNYFVRGEGAATKDFHWLTIYYDADIDTKYEAVETVSANIVAYVSSDYRWSFVLDRHIEKFQKDTADYGICHISISDFAQELLYCSRVDMLPREFSGIVWIEDDFMNDENITFDFESFSLIDEGVPYLNPRHFSVAQLVAVMGSRNTLDQYRP